MSFSAQLDGEIITADTQRAKALGITNILALRGDAPRPDEYADTPESSQIIDEFTHADDLVRYIRKQHGDFFCIGVAGYPTPHPDAENAEADMHWLKNKCDAGADYIITQLFYDVGSFETWVAACRSAGEWICGLQKEGTIGRKASFEIRGSFEVNDRHYAADHPGSHAYPKLLVVPPPYQPHQVCRAG